MTLWEPNALSQQPGLYLTKSDSQLEGGEHVLEKEIRRERFELPREKKIKRLRKKGELIMHSKLVLMMIVVLNLVDCCLVLGELILDIHYIKGLRDKTEERSQQFVDTMAKRYPDELGSYSTDQLDDLYKHLYTADCSWPPREDVTYLSRDNVTLINGTFQSDTDAGLNRTRFSRSESHPPTTTAKNILHNIPETVYETSRLSPEASKIHTGSHMGSHSGFPSKMWEDVAHGLHKASVCILGVLFFESIIKIICMGREFLSKKLEVFDVVVVMVSFVVDLVLLKGLTSMKVNDAVLFLSLLLPWRVIRLVNSLIVAVLDHEHFRLKMLYKEKKMINEKNTAKRWDYHLKRIESFCAIEGIPMWKIRHHTALCRNQSTITSMASLALCGIMPGMIVASEDKMMFNRSFEQGFAQNANAKHDSPKPNKATSNSDGVTVSEPSGLFKHHTIPVFNLDNMNESGDEDDNEGPLNLDTGNNSSVSTYILGSTFKTLHHSIQSDTGHSILIISSESHASQKRASVGNKEMQPLLEHQTSEDSDEYGGTVDHEVDHIEPFNNSNISKASYTVLNDIV